MSQAGQPRLTSFLLLITQQRIECLEEEIQRLRTRCRQQNGEIQELRSELRTAHAMLAGRMLSENDEQDEDQLV